ncbi:MAG: SsrA-binding protein SmpB [Candidatus Woesebacteria bacterium]|jgi:SsrA-binding protein
MPLVINKRAKFDYQISKTYHAGIVLTGPEVKSLRNKHASLRGSFIKILDGEAFLINAQINPYKFADNTDYDPKRSRKLLLKKKEIQQLIGLSDQKGWTIVPLSFELKRNVIKLNFGVGKGKKEYEKREKIKKRDIKRQIAKQMKSSY